MNKFKKEDLVLTMIKDDLTNWKMVHAFNALGFQADECALHASATILKVMRFKATGIEWEELHDEYLDRTHKVKQIDIL